VVFCWTHRSRFPGALFRFCKPLGGAFDSLFVAGICVAVRRSRFSAAVVDCREQLGPCDCLESSSVVALCFYRRFPRLHSCHGILLSCLVRPVSYLSFVAASWLLCHLLVVFSELRVSISFFTGSSAALTSSVEDWKISSLSSDLLFAWRQSDGLDSRYRLSSQGSSSPEVTNKKHHGDSKLSRVQEKIPFSVPFAATAVCD
jgi:hypothetical protein